MPEYVSVRTGDDSDVVVTVSAALAESNGLTVVDQPAVNLRGEPLGARRVNGRARKPRTSVDAEAKKKAEKKTSADTGSVEDSNATGGASASKA